MSSGEGGNERDRARVRALVIGSLVLLAGVLVLVLSALLNETVVSPPAAPVVSRVPVHAAELEALPAEEHESPGRSVVPLAPVTREVAGERSLLVRVREGETERPVEGARVSFLDAVAASDATGSAFLPVPESREGARGWVCVDARGFFSECEIWDGGEHRLEFRLWREVRLRVEVRDARSRLPVAGAKVEIQQGAALGRRVFSDFTDPSGGTQFGFRSGVRFDLLAMAEGFEVHERSLELTADSTLAIDLDPLAMVEGLVLLPDGSPAPGARVELWTDEGADEEAVRPRLSSSDKTSSDGHYRFPAPDSAALYHVRARDDRGRHAESKPFTVDPGVLRKETSLVLDWTGGQIVVHVVDEQDKALPGVLVVVTAWPNGTSTDEGLPTTFDEDVWTDTRGIAVCNTLHTGPYLVRVSSKRIPTRQFLPAIDGMTIHRARVQVERGERVELQVLCPEVSTLAGLVLDAAGIPVEGVWIEFEAKTINSWLGETSERTSAQTDESGRFLLDGLPAAPGRLTMGIWNRVDWFLEIASIGPSREELVFHMPEPAQICGRIEPNGAAAEIALILDVAERTFEESLETGADGSFAVSTGVFGKAVSVELVDDTGVPFFSEVLDLRAGQSCDLGELHLRRARPFHVSVIDDRGSPIVEPYLSIWDSTERSLYYVDGDENGDIPLPTLPAVAATILIGLDEDGVSRSFPCEDLSRLDGRVFVLHSLVHLAGQLSRVGDTSLGRAELQACYFGEDTDSKARTETMSDRAGRFTLDLLPGRVQLFARPFGELEWVAGPEIDIRPTEPASIDWVLE